jgi:hypothetical protein
MNNSTNRNESLDALAQILIRCFIMGLVFLAFCACFMVFANQYAYEIHSKFFDITKQQFDLICYGWMGLAKLWMIFVFLIPYIAIRLVLGKRT